MTTDTASTPFVTRFRSPGTSSFVALAAAITWLLRYASLNGVGVGPPRWAGHFDQHLYFVSSTAFLRGDLSPEAHYYPLLYPLLSAPFLLLDRLDPYLIPDMVLFAIAMVAFVRVACRLGIGATAATTFGLLACLAQALTARTWLDPWTTTLAAALIWWLIDRTLAIVLPEVTCSCEDSPSALVLLGALAAAIPLTRPADGVVGLVCLAITAGTLIARRRFTARAILCVFVGGLILVLPYAALHVAIYGLRATSYMIGVSGAGFVFSDLPWKAYTLIVSGRPWYPDTGGMIGNIPWFLPAVAGTLMLLTMRSPARAPLVVLLAVALPYSLVYIAFSDLLPSGLWGFGILHYFKWELPLGGVMFWVWLRSFASLRGATTAIAALVAAIAPTCIRALPVPVADHQQARMLLFRGDTTRVWNDAYFAKVSIVGDPQGILWNVGGFHQVPDATGERAIAVRRLFLPGVRRDDAGESAAFPQPQAPYARYGVGLSLGMPCWLRHSACTLPPTR